mmetsp:Transcript_7212/g.17540  ORF Transcript_7212/g.17540 Transcript_7212/m.17540 type:complete len:81 (-) Transcript_7212:850-1092(-)
MLSSNVSMTAHTIKEPYTDKSQRIHTRQARVKYEEEEVFVITYPNTIVHPRTVMVHFYDTPSADRTMMSSLWFECITPST